MRVQGLGDPNYHPGIGDRVLSIEDRMIYKLRGFSSPSITGINPGGTVTLEDSDGIVADCPAGVIHCEVVP